MTVIAELARGATWSAPGTTTFDVLEDTVPLPAGVVLSRRRETIGSIVFGSDEAADLAFLGSRPGVARAFRVESTVQLDGPPTAGPVMLVFFARRRDLSAAEFRSHWEDKHAPLARRHHIGMSRYVQHIVVEGTDDGVDAIAELHFASARDLSERFYDSEEGVRAIAEDVVRFSGRRADTYLVSRRSLVVEVDDPRAEDIRDLLAVHLAFSRETTPEEYSFALDVEQLAEPGVIFFSARRDGVVVGVAALKPLDETHAELKSMHTRDAERGRGVGRALVDQLLAFARQSGYRRVSLETGTPDEFAPARALYTNAGFRPCGPFGGYQVSPYNTFMTIELD